MSPVYFLLPFLTLAWNVFAQIDNEEAQFNPDRNSVSITDFSHSGSGCPAGSVLHDISPDNEVITLIFSDFLVEKESGINAPTRKNCRMRFGINTPPGWSHALFSMSVQGYADLEPGLVGIQNLNYSYADGTGRNKLGRMKIKGPYADEYVRSEQIPASSLSWSSCDRQRSRIVVNSVLAIRPRGAAGQNASGLMTTEVVENVLQGGAAGRMTQQFSVLWRKCQNGQPSRQKFFAARCQIELKNKRTGKVIKQVMVKARAKKRAKAMKKARRKATRRCDRIQNRRRNVSCQVQASSCQVVRL